LKVSAEFRAAVMRRADMRCEYCLIHQDDAVFAHEVDHIISRQHGGETIDGNLAYSCMVCNRYKGANLSSISVSGDLVRLFNPRLSNWEDHFRLDEAVIQPLDPIGEVTARLLRLNAAERVVRRRILQQLRRYPRS
jgi:5-methylcytosine-specific restriction endonuclease McrA